MELEEFITKTLVSIKKGISAANVELTKADGKTLGVDATAYYTMEPINREKSQGYISFDVAVTVNKETTKTGGAGIKVAVVNLGGEVTDTGTTQNVSRIKFHVMPWTHIS